MDYHTMSMLLSQVYATCPVIFKYVVFAYLRLAKI